MNGIILKSFFYKYSIVLAIIILYSISSVAQDRHYWYQQFGGRSTLLGGAVVGDVRDNSAAFYNPAALGFIKNNILSVSANAYNLNSYKIDNALGEGVDVKGYPFLIYPQLIGGFVPFTENQTWKWGYSLLTRNYSNYHIFSRYEDTREVFKHVQGDEKFIAGYEIQSKKQEQWGGITLGRMINKHWSFGATMFISYKQIQGSEKVFYKAFPQTDTPVDDNGDYLPFYVAKIDESRYYDIPIVNLIWKFGLAGEYEQWRFGVTTTLPAINLWFMKYGNVQREFEISNVTFEDDFLTDYLEIGSQNGRLTQSKTPFSVAFGASKKINKGKVLFSAEYFLSTGTNNILEADSKTDITSTPGEIELGKVPNMNVAEAYKSIFNLSVALEYKIIEKWNLLTSIRTDFNNHDEIEYDDDDPIEPYYTPWDIYHFTLGTEHIGEKSNVSFGIQYSFGFGETMQYQNFSNTDNSSIGGLISPQLDNMQYNFNGFTAIISYTYTFKNSIL